MIETKEHLEIEKMRLEIAEISKPWWLRFLLSGSFATIIVALIGYVGIWQTGYFDRRRAELETDVARLTQEQAQLQKSITNASESYKRILIELVDSAPTVLSQEEFRIPKDSMSVCEEGPDTSDEITLRTISSHIRNLNFTELGLSHNLGEKIHGILRRVADEMDAGSVAYLNQISTEHGIDSQLDMFTIKQPLSLNEDKYQIACLADGLIKPQTSDDASALFLSIIQGRTAVNQLYEILFSVIEAELEATPAEKFLDRPLLDLQGTPATST